MNLIDVRTVTRLLATADSECGCSAAGCRSHGEGFHVAVDLIHAVGRQAFPRMQLLNLHNPSPSPTISFIEPGQFAGHCGRLRPGSDGRAMRGMIGVLSSRVRETKELLGK